jgi:antitoxin (DNA-binding transcriptional repressor) of toxin-antitoxin stability system
MLELGIVLRYLQRRPGEAPMTITKIDIVKSPLPLADLLAMVRAGNEVILAEGNILLARITPIKPVGKKRIAGLNKGAFEVLEDFDTPLPDEFWLGEQ